MDFPLDIRAVLTIPGMAVLATIVILWLNQYVPKDQKFYTNIIALVICEVFAIVGTFILYGRPTAAQLYMTFLVGLFGTSLECFGYEAIKNLRAFGKPTT